MTENIIIFLIVCIIFLGILFIRFQFKKRRLIKVCEFLSNVNVCTIGYLYYCATHEGVTRIEIVPDNDIEHGHLLELMVLSSKPLTLERWFTKKQIEAINIGNNTLTQLRNEGKINEVEDIVPLIEELIAKEQSKENA